jgi:hypothetical protein
MIHSLFDPPSLTRTCGDYWMPACAGMTRENVIEQEWQGSGPFVMTASRIGF